MDNNIKNPSFRSSINGYNKDDVNRYIISINSRFCDARKKNEEKIKLLENTLERKERTLRELTQKLNGAKASENAVSYNENDDELYDETVENAGAEPVIPGIGAMFSYDEPDMDSETNAESDSEEQIKATIDENNAFIEELMHKAELYDKLSSQVGNIILDAQQKAEALVQNAEVHADDIRQKAENTLHIARESSENMLCEAEKRAGEMMIEAEKCASERIDKAELEISERIKNSKDKLRAMVENIKRECDSFALLCDDVVEKEIKEYGDT